MDSYELSFSEGLNESHIEDDTPQKNSEKRKLYEEIPWEEDNEKAINAGMKAYYAYRRAERLRNYEKKLTSNPKIESRKNEIISKVLNEWAWRTESGSPDYNNPSHYLHLLDAINEYGFNCVLEDDGIAIELAIKARNKARKLQKLKVNEIEVPIKVGDTVLMGKFKNKKVVVKSVGFNEKGDMVINGKSASKFRLISQPNIFDENSNKIEKSIKK